jgi:hypothetical protein
MNSANLCSLAGRYDNPIPPWFLALAPIDCMKNSRSELEFQWGARNQVRNKVVVSARQAPQSGGIGSLEPILGLLKSLKNRAL